MVGFLIAAFVWPPFLILLATATIGEVALSAIRGLASPPPLPHDIDALIPLARQAASQAKMRYEHDEER